MAGMVCEQARADLTSVGGWVPRGEPNGEDLRPLSSLQENPRSPACPARVDLGQTWPRRGLYGLWALMTAHAIPGGLVPPRKGGSGNGSGWGRAEGPAGQEIRAGLCHGAGS